MGVLEQFPWQSPKEREDARVLPLVFAKGLVIHEQVDNITIPVYGIDPLRIFLGVKRVISPSLVREPECDVVGKFIAFEQESDRVAGSGPVKVMRASPPQDMVSALCKDSLVSHPLDDFCQLIVIDQLSIAECRRGISEKLLHHAPMHRYLLPAFFFRIKERKAVIIGL